jgi:ComF family protein
MSVSNNNRVRMIKDFISLFFPRVCLTCGDPLIKGLDELCVKCLIELPKTNNYLVSIPEFEMKFSGIIVLRHVLVYLFFQKRGIVQRLLHELKYNNKRELGIKLGAWYGKELAIGSFIDEFDLILPIPLHKTKLRSRGYNQSEAFSEGLAKSLSAPVNVTSLIRIEASETQTNKSRIERWKNVEGIFVVVKKEEIAGKRVLLVDDVLTTGSTLIAAATPLLEAGAASVSVALLAAAK